MSGPPTFADFARSLRARQSADTDSSGSIVLVHMTKYGSYQVVQAHLVAAIRELHRLPTVAYRIDDSTLRERVFRWVGRLLGRTSQHPLDHVYRDMVDEVVVLPVTLSVRLRARREVTRFLRARPDRRALEQFTARGVHIGDLAYDKYIQTGHPVVDTAHPDLAPVLVEFVEHVIALEDLCDRRDVAWFVSIGSNHQPGVTTRVAIKRARPMIVADHDNAFRLSRHRPQMSRGPLDHHARFARLSPASKARLLEEADRFVRDLVDDGSGDLTVTGQRPWAQGPTKGLVEPSSSDRPRILVAVHSFYDDPHAVGVNLFPDFYAWIEHLVGLMHRTDYEWLFKLHPDQRDDRMGVRAAVETLLEPHGCARILPDGVGHPELLGAGVDLALTVYGTIGFEYPAAGVPVLTAGPDNPHGTYAYCLNAQTVEEYDRYLLDPSSWRYEIPRDEILEYVAMQYLHTATFPFHRPSVVRDHLAGNGDYFKSPDFRDIWAQGVTADDSEAMLADFREWIESGTFSLRAFLADRDARLSDA